MFFVHHSSPAVRLSSSQKPQYAVLLLTVGLLGTPYLYAQRSTVATQTQPGLEAVSVASETVPPVPEAPGVAAPQAPVRSAGKAMVDSRGASSPVSAGSFPTFRQRERRFLADFLGPASFIAPAFQAGIDTARPLKMGYSSDGSMAPGLHPAHGDVPEWGEGAQGYAKRYADRFGQGLISTTSRYVLGEAPRQDVTYHRCECAGFLPRTGHALAGAYLARTRGGRTVPSLPALVSPFIASEVAVTAWYPNRYNTSDALRVSVLNYVAAPFKNLYTEFLKK